MLTLCWPQLPLSCPYVGPMFAYVGLRNANPLSSDRKGGSDDGVTTGWGGGRPTRSAARAARLYNLRLPTEGLRQGHGRVAGPSNANPDSSDWEGLGKGGSAAGAAALIRQCRVTPKAKPSVALAIGRFRPCRRPPK